MEAFPARMRSNQLVLSALTPREVVMADASSPIGWPRGAIFRMDQLDAAGVPSLVSTTDFAPADLSTAHMAATTLKNTSVRIAARYRSGITEKWMVGSGLWVGSHILTAQHVVADKFVAPESRQAWALDELYFTNMGAAPLLPSFNGEVDLRGWRRVPADAVSFRGGDHSIARPDGGAEELDFAMIDVSGVANGQAARDAAALRDHLDLDGAALAAAAAQGAPPICVVGYAGSISEADFASSKPYVGGEVSYDAAVSAFARFEARIYSCGSLTAAHAATNASQLPFAAELTRRSLIHTASTLGGMSGSPVLSASGSILGIHIAGFLPAEGPSAAKLPSANLMVPFCIPEVAAALREKLA